MKKIYTRLFAVLLALALLCTSVLPAFAANTPEVDDYLDTTYQKAIDPYGSLQTDENGRIVIPLSKTSVSLKKDSRSQVYKAVWSSSNEAYAKITSDYSSSATAKLMHPTAAEGAKEVVLTLTLFDKNDGMTVLGTREYVLLLLPELPTYALVVQAMDEDGKAISDCKISVQDSRNFMQNPTDGVYSLKGETEYTVTVSAVGFIRNIQKVTLTQDTVLTVTLTRGTTVSFQVTTATGSKTDYATIAVTDDSGKAYSCVFDEYGYETTLYELPTGTYAYEVLYQNGSQTASGSFTVEADTASLGIPVQLAYTEYKVKFNIEPADANATISLYKNGASGAYGDPILPDVNGFYTIIFGQYRYTVEAEGFTTVSKTFNATDTSLKNNNYVINVRLESPYDKLLSDADMALFEASGEGVMLNEYSGMHTDIDFGYYADIDSDYADKNLQDTLAAFLAKEVPSAEKAFGVQITDVENDFDEGSDYSVIDENGVIHYDVVTEDMLDENFGGAVFYVSLLLRYENRTKESEVTVVVPMHILSRQERLDAAAAYAIDFSVLRGENSNPNQVQSDLHLSDLSDNTVDYFPYYGIAAAWDSNHPEIIDPETGKVTPAEEDALVTLSVKTYYTDAQIEEAGFLFDPGPLGDNLSVRTITLLVPGTKKEPGEKPTVPETPAKNPSDKTDVPSDKSETETRKENQNFATEIPIPKTGAAPFALLAAPLTALGTFLWVGRKKYIK